MRGVRDKLRKKIQDIANKYFNEGIGQSDLIQGVFIALYENWLINFLMEIELIHPKIEGILIIFSILSSLFPFIFKLDILPTKMFYLSILPHPISIIIIGYLEYGPSDFYSFAMEFYAIGFFIWTCICLITYNIYISKRRDQ